MPTLSRRRFLAGSAVASAGLLAAGGIVWVDQDKAAAFDGIDDPAALRTTSYRTLPGAAVPSVDVAGSDGRAGLRPSGSLLAAANDGNAGLLITDAHGSPVWWRPMPEGTSVQNFHVDTYRGEPVLVYYSGTVDADLGVGRGTWHILDTAYEEIATINAGNGQSADLHDMLLRDDGTAIVECYPQVSVDLSAHGGATDAAVLESVVQRVDVSTGEVLFEWHSLDHIPVTESYQDLDADTVDYMHVNTLATIPGDDDAVLVSARHLSQVFRLDLTDGTVGWRLGGRHPTVRLSGRQTAPLAVDDVSLPFSYQHDAQISAHGELTVFDNGNQRDPGYSRSVTYRLDDARRNATEAVGSTLDHRPAVYASAQGSVQRLPGDRTLVSWGGLGFATVYSQRRVEAEITGVRTYRLFLQDWIGRPNTVPTVVVTSTGLLASWNGSTQVRAWRVVDADDPSRLLATEVHRGFETAIPVRITAGTRVVVQGLDSSGDVLGRSRPVDVD